MINGRRRLSGVCRVTSLVEKVFIELFVHPNPMEMKIDCSKKTSTAELKQAEYAEKQNLI